MWDQENQNTNNLLHHWWNRTFKCIFYYKHISTIEITKSLNVHKNCAEFMQTKISLIWVVFASSGLQIHPFNVSFHINYCIFHVIFSVHFETVIRWSKWIFFVYIASYPLVLLRHFSKSVMSLNMNLITQSNFLCLPPNVIENCLNRVTTKEAEMKSIC